MTESSPRVLLRIELRDIETAVRRLGAEYRAKQRGEKHDGASAEFAALSHLADARALLDRIAEGK